MEQDSYIYPLFPGQPLTNTDPPECRLHSKHVDLLSDPQEPQIKVWCCSTCLIETKAKKVLNIKEEDLQMSRNKLQLLLQLLSNTSGGIYTIFVYSDTCIHIGIYQKGYKHIHQMTPRILISLAFEVNGQRRFHVGNVVNYDIQNDAYDPDGILSNFELFFLTAVSHDQYVGQTVFFRRVV